MDQPLKIKCYQFKLQTATLVDNNENLLENNFTVTKYYYTLKDTEIKQIENNIIKENLL